MPTIRIFWIGLVAAALFATGCNNQPQPMNINDAATQTAAALWGGETTTTDQNDADDTGATATDIPVVFVLDEEFDDMMPDFNAYRIDISIKYQEPESQSETELSLHFQINTETNSASQRVDIVESEGESTTHMVYKDDITYLFNSADGSCVAFQGDTENLMSGVSQTLMPGSIFGNSAVELTLDNQDDMVNDKPAAHYHGSVSEPGEGVQDVSVDAWIDKDKHYPTRLEVTGKGDVLETGELGAESNFTLQVDISPMEPTTEIQIPPPCEGVEPVPAPAG